MCLRIERFELLSEGFEFFLEILIADFLAGRNADVATRIQRPALRFDLTQCSGCAEAGDIAVDERCFPLTLAPLPEVEGKVSWSFAFASSPPRVKSGSSPR